MIKEIIQKEYLDLRVRPADDPPQGSFDGIVDLYFGAGPFCKIDWAGTFCKINQQLGGIEQYLMFNLQGPLVF